MRAKQIVVLGGGFAGLWAAAGAARKREELRLKPSDIEITLVNADAFHGIRVRNYEADLSDVRIPLDDVLKPIDVERVKGRVTALDPATQRVTVMSPDGGAETRCYDRLVFALGSQLVRPDLPGLREWTFDVDTYVGAQRLEEHLQSLPARADSPGKWTVVVVGGGLTGIEAAAEMPARLRAIQRSAGPSGNVRVILADRNPKVGSDMGDSARPVIETALKSLGVELRMGVDVAGVSGEGLQLRSGETIEAATVVWCAGMRASPLTEQIPVAHDRFGRLPVDEFLRVQGVPNVFAAGDVARLLIDGAHPSVMSCQHGRPMGRFAGHNVVADLCGQPLLPLQIGWYVTVLDLGAWGAVYTNGWNRHVVAEGAAAKKTKQIINCQRIYPPRNGSRGEILAAAAPVVQSPPESYEAD